MNGMASLGWMDGWMVVFFLLRSKCQHSRAWHRRSWEASRACFCFAGVLYEYHSIALTELYNMGLGGHQSWGTGDRFGLTETERRGTKWVNTGVVSGFLMGPRMFLPKNMVFGAPQ